MPDRLRDAPDNFSAVQVSVDTTGTVQIVGKRPNRVAVMVTQLSATSDIFIGPVSGVSSVTGDLLPGTKGAFVTIPYTGALFAVAPNGPCSVSVVELF